MDIRHYYHTPAEHGFFGGDNNWQNLNKINIGEFERYLNDGDVDGVVVVNKNLAQITLNQDALNKKIHEELQKISLARTTIRDLIINSKWNLELFQRKLEKRK